MNDVKSLAAEACSSHLSELIDDIDLMIAYALETDQLPGEVSIEEVYMLRKQKAAAITKEQIATLARYYEILNRVQL